MGLVPLQKESNRNALQSQDSVELNQMTILQIIKVKTITINQIIKEMVEDVQMVADQLVQITQHLNVQTVPNQVILQAAKMTQDQYAQIQDKDQFVQMDQV